MKKVLDIIITLSFLAALVGLIVSFATKGNIF